MKEDGVSRVGGSILPGEAGALNRRQGPTSSCAAKEEDAEGAAEDGAVGEDESEHATANTATTRLKRTDTEQLRKLLIEQRVCRC